MDLLERDLGGDIEILPGSRRPLRARARALRPASERREEVRQVDVVELRATALLGKVLLPAAWRLDVLAGTMAAELVVGGPLLRVLQGLVRLGDLLELRFAFRIAGDVRVVLVGELAVGLLDVVGARIAPDA